MIDDLDKDDVVSLMDDKKEEKKENEEDEPTEVQEVVDVVTIAKLITEVVTVASETVTAASITISATEPQVHAAATKTTALVRVAAASTRRRKGVVIRDLQEESTTIIPADIKSKDKGKGIMVEEPKPLKKKQQVEMDEEYARKLHEELNKDIDWDVAIEHVKQKAKEDPVVQRYQGMSYDDIRLIFEAKFNSNIEFLLKTKEQLEEEDSRAIQSINETPAQKEAKRRKLNKEVEDLKRHLEIVPDKDDDVYTEATPLAKKVPVVDYKIIHLNNKPHYKIIRADGTHQLNQMHKLKYGRIKGLFMVKRRLKAGSYWNRVEMYNPNITMEEYIQLEEEKARRREISPKPTITLNHVEKVDFDFEILFSESDDEDYTVIYDNDSFSYKIISSNDLKLDTGNDNDKINIEQSSGNLSIEPLPNVGKLHNAMGMKK
nr:hypothetical protein [Tanacetum cinerariifolium]